MVYDWSHFAAYYWEFMAVFFCDWRSFDMLKTTLLFPVSFWKYRRSRTGYGITVASFDMRVVSEAHSASLLFFGCSRKEPRL